MAGIAAGVKDEQMPTDFRDQVLHFRVASANLSLPRIAREDVVDGVLHVTNGIERDKLGFPVTPSPSGHRNGLRSRNRTETCRGSPRPPFCRAMAQRRRRRCREGGTPTATSSVAGPEAGLVGLHDGSRHETRADVPRLAREVLRAASCMLTTAPSLISRPRM